MRVRVLAALVVLATVPARAAAAPPSPIAPRNHLAGEASPYLQLHARNPVDWYPWGPEAFARARRENKPIFLSVGYSTCYWCHVMERRVFSDAEIARQMNASFVNVKVDREERPDIDELYLRATGLLTGAGGWPNSVFLTPEGQPFFAGSYFPPVPEPGHPSFPDVLAEIAARWRGQEAGVRARAAQVAAAITRSYVGPPTTPATPRTPAALDARALIARAVETLSRRFDPVHGGFGDHSHFPEAPTLLLLLDAHALGQDGATRMLRKTLDEMAWGGIRDPLAGGFHRYATEPSWSLPHFEKMLYDNAQLLEVYSRAYEAFGEPLYRAVAVDVADWLASEMSDPSGGFYSALDAEVEGREGASYVWTEAQVTAVLGPEAAARWLAVYELVPVSGSGSEAGALRVRRPVAATLARAGAPDVAQLEARLADSRARLSAARRARPQPRLDDKVLAAWNGLAIRGLVTSGVALDRPGDVERARRAARFVLGRLVDGDGRLHRSFVAGSRREDAVLDDYAFLADGLLALYGATGEPQWLAAARSLADHMLADYAGPDGDGFLLCARAAPAANDLFVRPRVLEDGVMPAGNAVALSVLQDLAARTGQARYREAAARTRTAFVPLLQAEPAAVATALRAIAASGAGASAANDAEPHGGDGPRPERRPPAPKALERLPTGRDFVHAHVVRGDSPGDLVVRLRIAPGWHVNANPASLDFLIPTRVAASVPDAAIDVVYPEGARYHPRFSLEPLAVYEGEVAIRVHPRRRLEGGIGLDLTFQACDASTCLPPETVRLELPTTLRPDAGPGDPGAAQGGPS